MANVADVKSLAIHPASTTHSEGTKEELLEQGIQENSVRLSIGIENVEDIIEDLEEAFKAIEARLPYIVEKQKTIEEI